MRYQLLGQPERAAAQTVQSLRAVHQSALDDGSWKAAWMLTYLQDPLSRERFGGTERELEVISGYLKNLDDLQAKMRKEAHEEEGGHGEEAQLANTDSWAPRGGRRPKGQRRPNPGASGQGAQTGEQQPPKS